MRKISVIEKNGNLYFQRLTFNQRIQHGVMLVSFTLLAATGLPLKFHHAWWGETLYALVGGITIAPILHRISAVAMTLVFFYHVFYVLVCALKYYILPLKKEGTLTFKTGFLALLDLPMVPNLTDLKELKTTLKYFLFLTNERPALVAHGLKEKFGYFAVFWGVPVIGLSGYFLWGESLFTKYFTGHVLNFAYIAHSDEAFLASIVIFIWHLYNVHLAPAVFPMGKAWLNGFVGEREMVQYHYYDYVKAMQDAELQDRILDSRTGYNYKRGFLSRVFEKFYMGVMIVAICISTVIISRVIYESVFVFGYQIVTKEPIREEKPILEPKFFEEIHLQDKEGKTFFREYRFVEEKKIKNHYHRIELNIGPDKISHCIKCHGDLPHGKSVHIRAFLNMHNLYFDCRICHVRPKDDKPLYYYWYNRSTGDIAFSPEIGDSPIDSLNIKLSPCNTCDSKPGQKDIETERALAEDFISRLKTEQLSTVEKEKIVEQIHENISEKRVGCKECHNKKDTFLPLEEIGYTKQKISILASDQITKMINEYKEFYNPSFMEPTRRTGR